MLVVADQVTKQLALSLLRPGEFVEVLAPGWGWQLVFNPGGAFGLPAPPVVFLVVTVLVVVLVARTLPRAPSIAVVVADGMLLAGAVGNAIDRVLRSPGFPRGEVVDFVAIRLPVYGDFPRFNVADAAITVGFVLLLLALPQDDEPPRTAAEPVEDARGAPPSRDP